MSSEPKQSAIAIAIKKQCEDERIRDVQLAVEQLFQREEKAVEFVLACLYDIGSENLINNKVPVELLKPPLRSIARYSRPAFRFLAIRWFHRDCPTRITNWLHTLVFFDPVRLERVRAARLSTVKVDAIAAQERETDLTLAIQQKQVEVDRLQGQLRRATYMAVTLAAIFGSATLWLGYELRQVRASSSDTIRPAIETSITR